MNKFSKSTKLLIILILSVIIVLVVGIFLFKNFNVKIDKTMDSTENAKIKLNDELWYEENLENSSYNIYDNEGNIIGIVYDTYGLDFYRENPDYRPSIGEFFYEDDDTIVDENVESN